MVEGTSDVKKNSVTKIYKVKGMHCNSCATLIEKELKGDVGYISASFAKEQAEISFDKEKLSEHEIKARLSKLGYELTEKRENTEDSKIPASWLVLAIAGISLIVAYYLFGSSIPNIKLPEIGQSASLVLLFLLGVLTSFHCISMCGGFVMSYTAKNAAEGHKGFGQHLVYGGSKVLSYTVIGGLFGLIGGVFAFSTGLRGWIAILAGIFMIFYALGMMGIGFFKRFQFNPKFLTKIAMSSGNYSGAYTRPLVTGLLNGLFIACGPLQAMYLFAAGTSSFVSGAASLAAFGLGTLPLMMGFGSFASVISHKTTRHILKISAVIVLILGIVMLNRGLALAGSPVSFDSLKADVFGGTGSVINSGIQEVNMQVTASGYSPNSFVLKKGVPVKWNINVKQLTGCNNAIIAKEFGINIQLKQGMNTVSFTPNKAGTFPFSCWMGMLRGVFIVTDTGQASQQAIKAAASASPSSGLSCGSGGGCGCGAPR